MKFCYNTSQPFLNSSKDLDTSYKMDLDLWDCFGRKNSILQPKKYGKANEHALWFGLSMRLFTYNAKPDIA